MKLLNQIKDEAAKHRQAEARRSKEITQLRKEQRLKEHAIRTLESEKKSKEIILRRKQEEVWMKKKQFLVCIF